MVVSIRSSIRQTALHLILVFSFFTVSLQDRFMIPHTHLDLGWLMTTAEYYKIGVSKIFESVLSSLENSPKDAPERLKRKFVFSEIAFVKMYINEIPDLAQKRLKRIQDLMSKGQLEFVNGGMSEADEACPAYEDFMENFFYGQRFLMTRFGKAAKSAWQVKAFGHSKAFFYLARKFGLTHGVITKMTDYKRDEWYRFRDLELAYNFPDNSTMYLHVLYDYTGPSSMACDKNCDIRTFDKSKLDQEFTQTDYRYVYDQYYLIGGDFHYENSASRFEYLDKVLAQYSEMKYALLSDYLKTFDQKKKNLSGFSNDLFVYQEGPVEHRLAWSGFFTSKPRLKYKIRQLGKTLRAVKPLVAAFLANKAKDQKAKLAMLDVIVSIAEDFGVLLHHQVITGTSVEAVDNDYFLTISTLTDKLRNVIIQIIGSDVGVCDFNDFETHNIDTCVLATLLAKNRSADFMIFNPSAVATSKVYKVIVKNPSSSDVILLMQDEKEVSSSAICSDKSQLCEVYFIANLPPLSFTKYTIFLKHSSSLDRKINSVTADDGSDVDKSSSNVFNVTDSAHKPKIVEIPAEGLSFKFDSFQLTIYRYTITYESSDNSNFINTFWFSQIKPQASGHYLLEYWAKYEFRPFNEFTGASFFDTDDIEGLHIPGTKIDLKIYQVKGENFYHIESFVKNTHDFYTGLDVLLNINSPKIDSGDCFTTDSNGLFDMQRHFYLRWEDSVYPVSSFIGINSTNSSLGLAVYNDRAQGGIAVNSTISVYLQRSASTRDTKGNYEILSVKEHILTHHIISNYILNSTSEDTDFTTIKHISDTEFPLYTVLSNSPFDQSVLNGTRFDGHEYPKSMRIGFDFYNSTQQMMRIQNISRKSNMLVDVQQFVKDFFGDVSASEIDFDYFFSEDKSQKIRPLRQLYDINPLDFVCVLILIAN